MPPGRPGRPGVPRTDETPVGTKREGATIDEADERIEHAAPIDEASNAPPGRGRNRVATNGAANATADQRGGRTMTGEAFERAARAFEPQPFVERLQRGGVGRVRVGGGGWSASPLALSGRGTSVSRTPYRSAHATSLSIAARACPRWCSPSDQTASSATALSPVASSHISTCC